MGVDRRGALGLIGSGFLGACASSPGGRVVGAVADAAARMGSMGQPEPSVDDVVDSITTLAFEDLERTPQTKKRVTIYYEIEDGHPLVRRDLFEAALPYVQQFYEDHVGVSIDFQEVPSLEDKSLIDNRTSFGIRYLSPENAVDAVVYELADPERMPESIKDNCATADRLGMTPRSCLIFRDRKAGAEMLKEEMDPDLLLRTHGVGLSRVGLVVLKTLPEQLKTFEINQRFIANTRKHAPVHVRYAFPVDLATRYVADTLCHEVGHVFGLWHTDDFVNDPFEDYEGEGMAAIPNLMSVGEIYETEKIKKGTEVIGTRIKRCSIRRDLPLGNFIHPLQVSIIHNRLAGGIVYQRLTTGTDFDYLAGMREANGFREEPGRMLRRRFLEAL